LLIDEKAASGIRGGLFFDGLNAFIYPAKCIFSDIETALNTAAGFN
jgi:hypothetical protein